MTVDVDRHPERYEFFQLMRVLENRARRAGGAKPAGYESMPGRELARFHADPALAFAPSAVRRKKKGDGQPAFDVAFCGIVGSQGVLPYHYTELAVERRHLKDEGLVAFLDVLHRRVAPLFHRAWLKYRLPFAFEHARAWREEGDDVSRALAALVGLGTGSLFDRPPEGAYGWLYFAGLFARPTRTAHGVEGIVGDLMRARVRVEQFVGQWVALAPDERTRLGSRAAPEGQHARLGTSCVVGDRVWDKSSRVRVEAGPLDAQTFRRFQPRCEAFEVLVGLVRSYLGPRIDVDFVWNVSTEHLEPVRLGGSESDGARLGWTSWLEAREPRRYDSRIPIWLDKAWDMWEHPR